jgi:hypothetical protein
MNAYVKQLWVEALRSGHYKQGKGQLRSTKNTFCCLGVLCDLYDKQAWTKPDVYTYLYHGEGILLPPAVYNWADITSDGQLGPGESTLMYFNDKAGLSFAKIADLIEEYL